MMKAGLASFTSALLILAFTHGSFGQEQESQAPGKSRTQDIDRQERETNQRLGQQWQESLGGGVQKAPLPRSQQTAREGPSTVSGRWRRVTSPQGRFTVELPEGWEIKPKDPQENPASFGPVGRDLPGVTIIGWYAAHTWQSLRTNDPRLLCRQVSAQEFYGQIFLPLLRQGVPDIKIERMIPNQRTPQASVEASFTFQGQTYRALDLVHMEYMADPTLPLVLGCPQAWYSLAFLGGLAAPPKEFAGLLPVSQRILSTFTPTPRWGAEAREIIFRGIETRLATIGQTLNRISKMEMDQRMQEIQSSRRINQGWIDTFGGVYRYKDPKDSSYEGTLPGSQVPSRPMPLWRCGFQQQPIYSETKPGPGCEQIQ